MVGRSSCAYSCNGAARKRMKRHERRDRHLRPLHVRRDPLRLHGEAALGHALPLRELPAGGRIGGCDLRRRQGGPVSLHRRHAESVCQLPGCAAPFLRRLWHADRLYRRTVADRGAPLSRDARRSGCVAADRSRPYHRAGRPGSRCTTICRVTRRWPARASRRCTSARARGRAREFGIAFLSDVGR